MKIFLDFETRSAVDIKKVGAIAYARHPSTDIMCMSYAIDDAEPILLKAADLKRSAPSVFYSPNVKLLAHNAHFEYAIWRYILHKRYGWPALDSPARWRCTLARAAAANLPISLDNACRALDIPITKDLNGRAAMLKLCKPIGQDPLGGTYLYREEPELYEAMYAYNQVDVEAERALDARLPELPESEQKIWEMDLAMNLRGIQTDVPFAHAAASMADELTGALNVELNRLTGGAVDKASRIAEIKRWLASQGLTVGSLDKAAVTALMADPTLPQHVKDVIAIRRQVGKSSTAKYKAVIDAADPQDGRVRGVLQYHAAGTGRWGGRLIQPQNFPKGLGAKAQEEAIALILAKDADTFRLFYGEAGMDTLSGALRGVITAAPGKVALVADYNAIEPRVLFWMAGDQSALNIYRRGESPYLEMGRFIYKREITKKDAQEYAVAKMTVLGAGYGMGAPRFVAQCSASGIDITEEMAMTAVKAYREKFHSVVKLWYATEAAALEAVRTPGKITETAGGRVRYGMDPKREFLCCQLPSGRYLRYFRPSIKNSFRIFCKDPKCVHWEKMDDATCPTRRDQTSLFYWRAGLTGALEEEKTYGGALVENIIQAIARDVMTNGMLDAEEAGFPPVLCVHDEVIAEVDEQGPERNNAALKLFMDKLCSLPSWAKGLPIAAEGFVTERYRK